MMSNGSQDGEAAGRQTVANEIADLPFVRVTETFGDSFFRRLRSGQLDPEFFKNELSSVEIL
jgi:hypothetical protein